MRIDESLINPFADLAKAARPVSLRLANAAVRTGLLLGALASPTCAWAAQHAHPPLQAAPSPLLQGAPDIAGVRLGMSEREALQAINLRHGSARFKRVLRHTPYSDGVNEFSSPEYLWLLEATLSRNDVVSMQFSALPGAQRIIAIKRRTEMRGEPDRDELAARLVEQYGAPVVSNARTHSVAWSQPGRPACWRLTPRTAQFHGAGSGADILGLISQAQRVGVAPRDATRCGYAIRAAFTGNPVRRMTLSLTDFGAWAASAQHSRHWVERLQLEARERRLSGTRRSEPQRSPPPEQVGSDPSL